MRVLVTGGLGFVGHAVTRQLVDAGHEPVVLTSREDAQAPIEGVQTVHADIRDRDRLAAELGDVAPEAVCHLAAQTRVRDSFKSPLAYFDVNVGGTIALLDALAALRPLPVVFASTGAVYGSCEGRIREDQPTLPTNPYGASKLAAEELLRFHAATGAVGAVVLRCFNVAGAVDDVGDSDMTRIIPKALAVAAGWAGFVSINGDGTAVREFTHVADVAGAAVAALEAAQPGEATTYNVGSGTEATMLDVVRVVEEETGQEIPVEHQPAQPEPAVLVADSERLRHELGWQPKHSALAEIVRDAWAAVRGRARPLTADGDTVR